MGARDKEETGERARAAAVNAEATSRHACVRLSLAGVYIRCCSGAAQGHSEGPAIVLPAYIRCAGCCCCFHLEVLFRAMQIHAERKAHRARGKTCAPSWTTVGSLACLLAIQEDKRQTEYTGAPCNTPLPPVRRWPRCIRVRRKNKVSAVGSVRRYYDVLSRVRVNER